MTQTILGREFAGVLVADCFLAYDAAALATWLHQKCVVHLLRELAQTKRGAQQGWVLELLALLRDTLALKAGATDVRAPAYEAAATGLEGRLDWLIAGARRSRALDRVRLGRRLAKHRVEILRFCILKSWRQPTTGRSGNCARRW